MGPCSGDYVCSVPVEEPATSRARWLAELEDALLAAQRLLQLLPITGEQRAIARELHLRIQAIRIEVQALRLSRPSNQSEVHPKGTEMNPWMPS